MHELLLAAVRQQGGVLSSATLSGRSQRPMPQLYNHLTTKLCGDHKLCVKTQCIREEASVPNKVLPTKQCVSCVQVVTVQFAVPTDDQDEFRLCSWLLLQPPAEATIAAAARAECPLHGLDFVEGSVAAATAAGG